MTTLATSEWQRRSVVVGSSTIDDVGAMHLRNQKEEEESHLNIQS